MGADRGKLSSLQGEMNRLFNTFLDTPGNTDSHSRWVPPMDLAERADDYIVTADLPGMDAEDVTIELHDGAEHRGRAPARRNDNVATDYHRVERARGTFRRELNLPEGVDPDSIEATFDRGVLEMRVPKPEQRKP